MTPWTAEGGFGVGVGVGVGVGAGGVAAFNNREDVVFKLIVSDLPKVYKCYCKGWIRTL